MPRPHARIVKPLLPAASKALEIRGSETAEAISPGWTENVEGLQDWSAGLDIKVSSAKESTHAVQI
jgi:hypothetical protein